MRGYDDIEEGDCTVLIPEDLERIFVPPDATFSQKDRLRPLKDATSP